MIAWSAAGRIPFHEGISPVAVVTVVLTDRGDAIPPHPKVPSDIFPLRLSGFA